MPALPSCSQIHMIIIIIFIILLAIKTSKIVVFDYRTLTYFTAGEGTPLPHILSLDAFDLGASVVSPPHNSAQRLVTNASTPCAIWQSENWRPFYCYVALFFIFYILIRRSLLKRENQFPLNAITRWQNGISSSRFNCHWMTCFDMISIQHNYRICFVGHPPIRHYLHLHFFHSRLKTFLFQKSCPP